MGEPTAAAMFVDLLLQLARAGGRPADLDAVAQVLKDAGFTPYSASSLSRAKRGTGGAPVGSAAALDSVIATLGGADPACTGLAEQLRHAHARLPEVVTPRRRTGARVGQLRPGGFPPLPSERREAAKAFLAAVSRWQLLHGSRRKASARQLKKSGTGSYYAGAVFNFRVALPPTAAVAWLLYVREATDAPLSPPAESEFAALIDLYEAAYGSLFRDHADHESALAALRQMGRAAVSPVREADPAAVDDLVRLSRRRLAEANPVVGRGPEGAEAVRLDRVYVPRKLEAKLTERHHEAAALVVVGEAGVGKTSLLWRTATTMRRQGRPVFFLRASDLVHHAETARTAAPHATTLPAAPVPVLQAAMRRHGPEAAGVILLDTVDLLLRSGDVPNVLIDVLNAAAEEGFAVVMTCRDREYTVLASDAERLDLKRHTLGAYEPAELTAAVRSHTRYFLGRDDAAATEERILAAAVRGLPIQVICQHPLHLRLLFETALAADALPAPPEPDADADRDAPADTDPMTDPDVDDIIREIDVTDLYERYWRMRVVGDDRINQPTARERDESKGCQALAVLMLAVGEPRLEQSTVEQDLPWALANAEDPTSPGDPVSPVQVLRRRNVLLGAHDDPSVEFFHQTLFEYAAAQAVTAAGQTAVDAFRERVEALPNDLFIAAVMQQVMIYACRSRLGATRVDAALAALLGSAQPNVVQMAVAAYAQARYRGPLARRAAVRLLEDASEGILLRYVTYVTRVRHDEQTSTLDELAVVWRRSRTDTRIGVLQALRVLAEANPNLVLETIVSRRIDVLAWLGDLPAKDLQIRRAAPLNLLESLATADRGWVAGQLLTMSHRMTDGAKTQEALAAAVAAAARVLHAAAYLQPMLGVVPALLGHTDRGIHDLKHALAAVYRRIWLDTGQSTTQTAEALIATAASTTPAGAANAAGTSTSDARANLLRHAQLLALAQMCIEGDVADFTTVLSILLGCRAPHVQTDISNCFLRRILDGRHGVALPGAPPPGSGLGTEHARLVCAGQLRRLPQPLFDKDGGRNLAILWRDALSGATMPPQEVADVSRSATRGRTKPGLWTRTDGLCALLVPSALGGHPGAVTALQQWSSRSTPAGDANETSRKVIAWRLRKLAHRYPAAYPHLLADAAIETDGQFLLGALDSPEARTAPIPADVPPRIVAITPLLLASNTPQTKRDAFELLRKAGAAYTVDASLLVDELNGTRHQGTLNSIINLIEATLDNDASRLSAPAHYAGLVDALQQIRDRGTPPDHEPAAVPKHPNPKRAPRSELAERAAKCLRQLHCRCGPVADPDARSATTDVVRSTVLQATNHEHLAPLGYFMSRLSAVDPAAAAATLLEASHLIAAWQGSETTWKRRRAHRWRAAIADILAAHDWSDWKTTIANLAGAELNIFTQAMEVSIQSRGTAAEKHLDTVINDVDDPGGRLRAAFTNAVARHQRVIGSQSAWPHVLELCRTALQPPH